MSDETTDSHRLLEQETLEEIESGLEHSTNNTILKQRQQLEHRKIHIITLYVLLGILSIVSLWSYKERKIDPSQTFFTPAQDAIRYETKVFLDNIGQISPYQGEPNDVKDEMWDFLYRDTESTLISASAAARLPNHTVVAPGTEGAGIISLEVFHQLHCLNALRKSLYPERFPDYSVFFSNATRKLDTTIHHDHCIDRLRQAIMCASDVGASYWRWSEHSQRWMIRMETTHTCRDFESIRRWAVERNLRGWDDRSHSRLTA